MVGVIRATISDEGSDRLNGTIGLGNGPKVLVCEGASGFHAGYLTGDHK